MRPAGAALVDALADANVQFVVVGEVTGLDPLRVVVSRHPTNLDALGRALDRLGAKLQLADEADTEAAEDGGAGGPDVAVPERVGDPLGTLSVATAFGHLTLMFGGPSGSLYAETVAASRPLEVGGRSVAWAAAPAATSPGPRTTGRALGRRLLSLVEGLAHLVDQRASDERGGDAAGPGPGPGSGPEPGPDAGTTMP